MNDFVSWCMHLLVLFLFHDVTSLTSLQFPLKYFHLFHSLLVWGKAPNKNEISVYCPARSAACTTFCTSAHALARAHGQRPCRANYSRCTRAGHAENGVVQCLLCKAPRSTVDMAREERSLGVHAHLRRLWRHFVK